MYAKQNKKAVKYSKILKRNDIIDKEIFDELFKKEDTQERFPIFEELLIDIKIHDFESFVEFDWQCISSMKYLTLDFIRINFDHLDVNNLLTFQNLPEHFIVEMIETLLPRSGKDYDIFQILNKIFTFYKNLSIKFRNKYYPKHLHLPFQKKIKIKKQKEVRTSEEFENIINYIEENYNDDYMKLDMKTLSSYKFLSHSFMIRHAKKFDYKVLFNIQKVNFDVIHKLSLIDEIPLAPLLNANNDLTFDFILNINCDIFIDEKTNKQIGDKVLKGSLKMCNPERYNHIHWYRKEKKIYDDNVLTHRAYKLYNFNTYQTTMFMDLHPYINEKY